MLRDIEYFDSKLGKMAGCDGIGKYLITIIKSKQVKGLALAAAEPETKDTDDTSDQQVASSSSVKRNLEDTA
jgi:hypothetical protein